MECFLLNGTSWYIPAAIAHIALAYCSGPVAGMDGVKADVVEIAAGLKNRTLATPRPLISCDLFGLMNFQKLCEYKTPLDVYFVSMLYANY